MYPINLVTMNVALMALAVLVPVSASQADSFYVAANGSDANPGTLTRPFATLRQAQQAARKEAGRDAVTIFIREGTYYLPETMVFTAEDSGTKAAPVLYQAYEKEKAVISGGVRLKDLQWENYKDGIMQAKVPAGLATDQLFVNGERQHLARYPNFDPRERHFNGWAKDAFSPQRAARWQNPAGGFIHALHSAEWGGMHYVITGKGADNKVTYEGGWQNNRPMGMHDIRFVENIFEELDAPGEWFLDAKNKLLYFYPPPGIDLSAAIFEAVRLRHLVEFRGTEQSPVRFVSFKGLTFRHAARTFMENKEPLVRSDWTTYRGGAVFFTGSEDCSIEDCFIDQVGGNAVFVNNYNRRLTVRGCHIAKAGANGVAFVGDRDSARVPRDWKDHSQSLQNLDRTPGPRTANYPADCLVDDCLIYLSGRVEKQTAPVQIELSQGITVRHCSLYDVPRAGINIGDGCWGGHVIEFCDIFDTVKETGDHGSFNSWGRDRFWGLGGLDLNNDQAWEANKDVVLLDALKTTILRNNRWRCDHGWDIDLDDGSSSYEIRNNLCLNGGLKNREGFFRVVENNIMVNNGFHPHVWYKHSEDIFRRNILFTDHYLPAGGMPASPWGREMDNNLVHVEGVTEPEPAAKLAEQSRRDAHSIVADALFVDPARGDFRVRDASPALKLGFVNFPMDQFGVQKPELKAVARTPEMPQLRRIDRSPKKANLVQPTQRLWQAQVRNISGLGDRSAYGLPDESGVLLLDVPPGSPAAKAGFQKDDVIVACNGQPVRTIKHLQELRDQAAGRQLSVSVNRKQKQVIIAVYPARETRAIAGWTVHISRDLLAQEPKAAGRALELLQKQLEEIVRVAPQQAVAELQKVTLYFSPEYAGVKPRAEFHPGAGWLRDNGRDPEMAKGVEFTNIRIFEPEMNRMPNFALHELAHAYHDRVLPQGFDNLEIKAAYERARAGGKYDRVERWHGNGKPNTFERAYAMENPQEFFAENTEAFFSRNDFFPFTRDELKQHDPETFALLEKLWAHPFEKSTAPSKPSWLRCHSETRAHQN